MSEKVLILIVGPTAVGKTACAIEIASKFDTEIISCDSRQFYKDMIIGTASPSSDELSMVKHHFIGHLDISETYNVFKFETDAILTLKDIFTKSDYAVMTGGSGLYADAVCYGIDLLPDPDPQVRSDLKNLFIQEGINGLKDRLKSLDLEYYNEVDLSNPNRIIRALEVCLMTGEKFSNLRKNIKKKRNFKILKIGLTLERHILCERINSRVDQMILSGLEVEAGKFYSLRHLNSLNTVGYKEFFDYFDGKTSKDFAIEKIKTNTRRYAKRQMTWLRRYDDIKWFSPNESDAILKYINENKNDK